jgi:hypothetical protein
MIRLNALGLHEPELDPAERITTHEAVHPVKPLDDFAIWHRLSSSF